MKKFQIITIILFASLILIPIGTFNLKKDAVSMIDNRKLADNPFLAECGDLTDNIESYVNDRIGLRDQMISGYTILNDKLFGKMVHPSYTYGKDGYVFGSGITVSTEYNEYHEAFADMLKQIQNYCEERSIPFLFMFDPAKPAILSDYIADGINYDRTWVDEFFEALDKRGVHYVDNTVILQQKTDAGEIVYNKKYDANHWNSLGAYYGTNAALEQLQKEIPTVHINTSDDLIIEQTLQTSLPVSNFPINEMVPKISVKMDITDNGKCRDEVEIDSSFRYFSYYINQKRVEENAPKALVFQGSYMNVYGYPYFENAFGEYIGVHNYQNITNFQYYFNIFKPDCVIFEVAEYTIIDYFFNLEKIQAMKLNPSLESTLLQAKNTKTDSIDYSSVSVEQGETLTEIKWSNTDSSEYAWLYLGYTYDLIKTQDGYEVTISNENYKNYENNLTIVTKNSDNSVTYYS